MKNTYILIIAFVSLLSFSSCETDYDSFEEDRSAVVGLARVLGSSNVSLDPGDSTDKEIEAFVSDVASVDRTFNFGLDTDLTMVNAENFTFNPQFVVPAGERRAIIVVTVTNISLPVEYGDVVLQIADSPEYVTGGSATFRARLKP